MPLSSPADVGCEVETHVRETDGWNIHSSHLFLGLGEAENVTTKNPSTFEKIQLIVQMNVHYAYLVRSFCSPRCEPNITGRFLELHPEYHTNINTTFWNFEQWWMLWHRTVTFNPSPQNSLSLEHIVQYCFPSRVGVECALADLVAGAPCCRTVTRNLRNTLRKTEKTERT